MTTNEIFYKYIDELLKEDAELFEKCKNGEISRIERRRRYLAIKIDKYLKMFKEADLIEDKESATKFKSGIVEYVELLRRKLKDLNERYSHKDE